MMRATLLAITVALTGWPAFGADFSDPDWPCIQRKVPQLWIGQMWTGPAIEEPDLQAWRKLPDVAALAPVLAVRRTSEDAAEALVGQFAEAAGDARDEKLRLLFAGAFTLIDRERSQIISGIGRYARTQTALSAGIEETQNQLTELQAIENPDFDTQDKIEEIEDQLLWDTRIYKDRQQSLTYVCETPVILEKRAFALARMIMARME